MSARLQQRLDEKTDHIALLTKKIDNMSKEAKRKDMRVEAERKKVQERDEKIHELKSQLQGAQEVNHAITRRKKAKEERIVKNERTSTEILERERQLRVEASSLRAELAICKARERENHKLLEQATRDLERALESGKHDEYEQLLLENSTLRMDLEKVEADNEQLMLTLTVLAGGREKLIELIGRARGSREPSGALRQTYYEPFGN